MTDVAWQNADPDALAGPVHYALRLPALGPAEYARLQAVLLRGTMVRTGWRRHLVGLAAAVLVGTVTGVFASYWDVGAELWIASARTGWMLSLDGFEVLFAAIGVAAVTTAALGLTLLSRQRRAVRALHAAGGDLFGGHDLLLGERGVLWRNPSRVLFVPWPRLTGAVRDGGMIFLLADRISAFWLPEALVARHPDRAGLEALIRRHVALP